MSNGSGGSANAIWTETCSGRGCVWLFPARFGYFLLFWRAGLAIFFFLSLSLSPLFVALEAIAVVSHSPRLFLLFVSFVGEKCKTNN